MKILLVCAGGLSTSMLMQKMEKYASANGIDLKISAKGAAEYAEFCKDYDIILLGPQISYQKDKIEKESKMPIMTIAPYDYAIGNSANIFKEVNKILN